MPGVKGRDRLQITASPRARFRLSWFRVAARAGLAAALVFAGIAIGFCWGVRTSVTFPFEKGSSPWTQVPWPAVATMVVGSGGLGTFWVNKRQKDVQFEQEALRGEFTDILDRLAVEPAYLRASAVARLADMAERRWPGTRTPSTSHPFFRQASSQLSTALHLECDATVRNEIVNGLRRMATFARQENLDLLGTLIQDVASANRSARRTFTEGLAELCAHMAGGAQPYQHPEAAGRALICLGALPPRSTAAEALNQAVGDLLLSDDCRVLSESCAIGEGAGDQLQVDSALRQIREAYDLLDDARRALEQVLQALPDPARRRRERAPERGDRLDLSGCFLPGADLARLGLDGVDLSGTVLHAARLSRASLELADLTRALLPGADLSQADMRDCTAVETNLVGAQLSRAILAGATLRRADLTNAYADGADLADADLEKGTVDHCVLHGANLHRAKLWAVHAHNSILDGATLTEAQLAFARFTEARLLEADLTQASILGAHFTDADLTGAKLDAARRFGAGDLDSADKDHGFTTLFAGAILAGASLARADLRHTDLRGALGLTKEQISSSVIDSTTQVDHPDSAAGS